LEYLCSNGFKVYPHNVSPLDYAESAAMVKYLCNLDNKSIKKRNWINWHSVNIPTVLRKMHLFDVFIENGAIITSDPVYQASRNSTCVADIIQFFKNRLNPFLETKDSTGLKEEVRKISQLFNVKKVVFRKDMENSSLNFVALGDYIEMNLEVASFRQTDTERSNSRIFLYYIAFLGGCSQNLIALGNSFVVVGVSRRVQMVMDSYKTITDAFCQRKGKLGKDIQKLVMYSYFFLLVKDMCFSCLESDHIVFDFSVLAALYFFVTGKGHNRFLTGDIAMENKLKQLATHKRSDILKLIHASMFQEL